MFENVTYDFYTTTLERDIVPSELDFKRYKLENVQYVKSILPFITENEVNGVDSAVCLMIEVQYRLEQEGMIDGRIAVSESVSGFSQSFDVSKIKTLDSKRTECLRLFCTVYTGVR